jgi:Ras-related protein Rab-7A
MQRALKFLVLGDSNVGKTSLLHRLVHHEYRDDFPTTIGANFWSIRLEIQNTPVEIQLWETESKELPMRLAETIRTNVSACILVFDLTEAQSFANLVHWRKYAIEQLGICDDANFPFLVLGSKADVDAQARVDRRRVRETCLNEKMALLEVSAKTGELVAQAFQELATVCLSDQFYRKRVRK